MGTNPRFVDPPSWYALQSRSRHEKMVTAALNNQGVTTFLPLVPEVHRWTDRSKVVQVPLFPGYVFVQLPHTSEAQGQVLRTSGVVRLVGNHRGAVAIPEKEIEDVRTVLAHRRQCEPYPFLRNRQRVKVVGGALNGVEGVLLKRESENKLVISIGLIERALAVSVHNCDLEPIPDYPSFAA